MAGLAAFLLSPLTAALAAGLVGWLLGRMGWQRLGRAIVWLGIVWMLVWSLPAASDRLRGWIEGKHPAVPVEQLPRAQAIVVLGGAIAPPMPGRPLPDLGGAADRLWHAARLYRAGRAPWVLVSGGSDPKVTPTPEAQAMKAFLVELGVPERAVLTEGLSRNTRENARFSAEVLRKLGVQRILLVTSALHMPRAKRIFEGEGFQVIAAAADHEIANTPVMVKDFLPDAQSLSDSGRALKEAVGLWIR